MKNLSILSGPRIRLALSILLALLIVVSVPIRSLAAPLLRNGSRGEQVLGLQEALLDAGFNPGPLDGDFGPKTEAALRSFQSFAGIASDGICGPVTLEALDRGKSASRSAGPLRGRTIVVDPGHGGNEPGAISVWGDKEKDFTLAIASKLRVYLEDMGAIVVMTRYGDYSPGSDWGVVVDELLARVSLANSREADLFVSVHINAFPKDPAVSGVMGFYRRDSAESQTLASTLASKVAANTGLKYIDTQVGPYYVLNHTYMPAALIEVGFMTCWNDVTLLRQNWFIDSAAKGLSQGIAQYFGR